MTHESLPAANVPTDATVERVLTDGELFQQRAMERIRGTEDENTAFLTHLALNTQIAYYLSSSEEKRTAVHEAFRTNIDIFLHKTPAENQDIFIELLALVDEDAQQSALTFLNSQSQRSTEGTALEVLAPHEHGAEPSTLILPVTPETPENTDELEALYAAPATEFDTPISLNLSELWQHPYETAKKFGRLTLERAGIIQPTE